MSDETKATQVFVVQQLQRLGVPEDDGKGTMMHTDAWVDIATITLPAHTPRRIAVKEALKDAGFIPGTGPVKLRALDVKSAEVFEPEAVQPPMEWKL